MQNVTSHLFVGKTKPCFFTSLRNCWRQLRWTVNNGLFTFSNLCKVISWRVLTSLSLTLHPHSCCHWWVIGSQSEQFLCFVMPKNLRWLNISSSNTVSCCIRTLAFQTSTFSPILDRHFNISCSCAKKTWQQKIVWIFIFAYGSSAFSTVYGTFKYITAYYCPLPLLFHFCQGICKESQERNNPENYCLCKQWNLSLSKIQAHFSKVYLFKDS